MNFRRTYSLRVLVLSVAFVAIACVICLHFTAKPDLKNVVGVRVTATRDQDTSFFFTDDVDLGTTDRILGYVSKGYPLHFFDKARRMDNCLGGTASIVCVENQFGVQFWSDRSGTAVCPISREEAEKLIWVCMSENSTRRSQHWESQGKGGCQLNNQRWMTDRIGPYDEKWHGSVYKYLQSRIASVELSSMPQE